jgi:hypothetical protein
MIEFIDSIHFLSISILTPEYHISKQAYVIFYAIIKDPWLFETLRFLIYTFFTTDISAISGQYTQNSNQGAKRKSIYFDRGDSRFPGFIQNF